MRFYFVIILLSVSFFPYAQSYQMSNLTVYDCNADFTDSDAGSSVTPSYYGHNEDLTFSICPAGADSVILTFTSFCSELNLDIISFYDGPNTASPQIGISYSGIVSIPPIIATSGCLTVHFESDASVACEGWQASWQSIINVPENPVFDPITNPACSTTTMILSLDQEMLCTSVNASNFTLFGPNAPAISSVTPINCINGTTNTIQVDFANGLNENGNYSVQFEADFLDACDSLWQLTAYGNFAVSDCPISVEISGDTSVCTGICTDLEAFAWGGDGNYTYVWNNGLPNGPGPHTVCPTNNTTYSVTVTDGSGAIAGQEQITVNVVPQAILPANFTVCQSDPVVDLDAIPNTGYWNGPCFGNDTLAGIFHPGWCGTGVKTIYYNNGGCIDSMEITVNPMSVGATNQLVCPGSPPFNIWTNNPGGVWTGNGITDTLAGTFDPVVAGPGVHYINYSNPPCADRTKIIRVDTPVIQADDTICINDGLFEPVFNPKGGTWTGPGVTNWYWCRMDPSVAGPGTHNLVYTYGNCADTLRVTVLEIDAGTDMVVCPFETPFNLTGTPTGGYWIGSGITDSLLGTFNPLYNSGNNFNSWVKYYFNGCVDSIIIRGRNTVIPEDTLNTFCDYEADFLLNFTNTERAPGGGAWSGVGITNPSANGVFSPSSAMQGTHMLYYEANTCIDSAVVIVFPNPELSDTAVCIEQSAFDLPTSVAGGQWSGNGIVNPNLGTFLPSLAGIGTHTITYQTSDSCFYSLNIDVDSLPDVLITGLPANWCYDDTVFHLQASPFNGVWSGAVSDSIVDVLQLGSGVFTVQYTYGTGECAVSTSATILIEDTLELLPYFEDTIVCAGDYVRIGAQGEGGNFLNYSYQWQEFASASNEFISQVDSSMVYHLFLNDGCSRPDTAQFQLGIFPDFNIELALADTFCFGTPSFVDVTIQPPGQYTYIWDNDTLQLPTFSGDAGTFVNLEIINNNTACFKDTTIGFPSYSQLVADFLPIPNETCLDLIDNEIYIIDQSIGAISGNWNFGDNTNQAYIPFTNFYHEYLDTGAYEIVLQVVNEGGCVDEQVMQICVKPKSLVIAPTAFSPNGDGMNDEFFVRTIGTSNEVLSIYDRWGNLVFETDDITQAWNGTYLNKATEVGTYSWSVTYYSLENKKEEIQKGNLLIIR